MNHSNPVCLAVALVLTACTSPASSASPSPTAPAAPPVPEPTNPSLEFRVTDTPLGFASVGATSSFGGAGGTVVTVSTAADLKAYAKKGGYTIYVDGMIDVTEGMLPSTWDGTNTKLDAFLSKYTSGAYTT